MRLQMTSSGRMPKGSSHCTPISSMPQSTAAMPVHTGTTPQPVVGYSAKGSSVSHANRKRAVCLHETHKGEGPGTVREGSP